jgi:hypothetical protein
MQSGIPQPIAWFAADASASSVFVPFFTEVLAHGEGKYDVEAYGTGSMKTFNAFTEAGLKPAWWAFDFVANYMEISYKNMSETYVYPKVQELQTELDTKVKQAVQDASTAPTRKDAALELGRAQTGMQRHVVQEWWRLADMLVVRYNDGFFNFGPWAPQTVGAIGYPSFWLEMIGYSQESYYPTWFSRNATPPALLSPAEHALVDPKPSAEHPIKLYSDPIFPSSQVVLALLIGIAGGYRLGLYAAAQGEIKNGDYLRIEP